MQKTLGMLYSKSSRFLWLIYSLLFIYLLFIKNELVNLYVYNNSKGCFYSLGYWLQNKRVQYLKR